MRGNFGVRLKTQLIAVFTILLTVLLGLVGILTYQRVESVVERQSADITQQYFRQNAFNIRSFSQEIDNTLKLLTQITALQEYMESGWRADFDVIMNANEVFENATQLMSNYDYIESVYFFGADGVVLGVTPNHNLVVRGRKKDQPFYSSSIHEKVLENRWESYWFGTYTSEDFRLESETDPEIAVPFISIARSVNIRGRHVATAIVNIRQSVLADMIGYADEDQKRESFLIDENGLIVVHRNGERMGEQFAGFEDMQNDDDGYFMLGDMQVNYRSLDSEGMPWTLISEVPAAELYKEIRSLRQWFVLIVVAGWAVAWGVSYYWLYRLTKPLDELRRGMRKMGEGDLGWQLENGSRNELGVLGQQFNHMSENIRKLVAQVQNVEREKSLLEQEALQAQINPHFLFNTLSNIKYMAMIVHSNTIVECITALGNFLSPIYKSEGDFWSIEQEKEYIGNYVKIMNYRFGGRISISWECPKELKTEQILKFIVQPLVENAISHGFENREGEGKIRVYIDKSDEKLSICVEDDGRGMSEKELALIRGKLSETTAKEADGKIRKGHIGIYNVHRRLQLYYGQGSGLLVESQKEKGTRVIAEIVRFSRKS